MIALSTGENHDSDEWRTLKMLTPTLMLIILIALTVLLPPSAPGTVTIGE